MPTISVAGKQLGTEDDRHLWPEMLRAIREVQPTWVVGENVPGLVNWSKGLVFEQVQADLEAEGYEVQSFILPACGVNAPHRRDRVWIVAYCNGTRLQKARSEFKATRIEQHGELDGTATNTDKKRLQSEGKPTELERGRFSESHSRFNKPKFQNFPTQSPICTRNDGFQTESLRHRIREDSMGTLSEKEIDKILSEAHSEWTKETIKAGGNAIVHQVALQIFRSIEQFNQALENN